MVQYYRDTWRISFHVLDPLTEAYSGPKGRKKRWNENIEIYFKNIKHMVYAETQLNYHKWKITFTVHTDVSDKKLGGFIS